MEKLIRRTITQFASNHKQFNKQRLLRAKVIPKEVYRHCHSQVHKFCGNNIRDKACHRI